MKKNSIKKTIVVLVLVMGLCAVLFSGTSAYGGMRAPGGTIIFTTVK